MNESASLSVIKNRLTKSFFSLVFRQIVLGVLNFVTVDIILARVLSVETIGVFNISIGIISFFAFFSDVGLAASLIQKKEEIKSEDIKTTFTIQQSIVGLLSLAIVILAPLLGSFYQLNDQGIWLIRILGLSFFLSSLKVIPSVMLERDLKFQKIVTIEIVETVLFNLILIVLAFMRFDIWSFSIATLVRGIVGVSLIYIIAPIQVGFGFSLESAKKLLSFGIPYQINSVLALLKDRLVPLVVAKMIGSLGVGYVTWAQGLAFIPLQAMSAIITITFPLFSRLQDNKKSLSSSIEMSLFVTTLVVYPLVFGSMAILPSVITYVVSSKWQPAQLSFYLFSLSTLLSVISTIFTNALSAIGKIKITLKLMIFWTVLTWILTPLLVVSYGFVGVAISTFLISLTSIITIILTKRLLTLHIFNQIWLPALGSILMAAVVYLLSLYLVRDKLSLGVVIVIGGLIYVGFILLVGKRKLINQLKVLSSKD